MTSWSVLLATAVIITRVQQTWLKPWRRAPRCGPAARASAACVGAPHGPGVAWTPARSPAPPGPGTLLAPSRHPHRPLQGRARPFLASCARPLARPHVWPFPSGAHMLADSQGRGVRVSGLGGFPSVCPEAPWCRRRWHLHTHSSSLSPSSGAVQP